LCGWDDLRRRIETCHDRCVHGRVVHTRAPSALLQRRR